MYSRQLTRKPTGNALAIVPHENAKQSLECVHNSRFCVETHCSDTEQKHKQSNNGRRKQPGCVESYSQIQIMCGLADEQNVNNDDEVDAEYSTTIQLHIKQ